MSTTTEDRTEERSHVSWLAEVQDRMRVVEKKVVACEAASRSVESAGEGEGIEWILRDIRMELESVRDVVRRVWGECRQNGERPPEDRPHLTLDEGEVQTVLAVSHAVAVASDGELGDNTTFDRTPKSLRPVWSALTDRMEPLVARLREAAGMSMEEELRVGYDALSSIKGSLRAGEEVAS